MFAAMLMASIGDNIIVTNNDSLNECKEMERFCHVS